MSEATIRSTTNTGTSFFGALIQRWGNVQTAGLLLLFAATFFNMADLIGGKVENKLDFQVMIKLCICAGCGLFGLYGVFNFTKVPRVLLSPPTILLLAIGILFLASVPFSLDRRSTFVSTSLYWTMFLAVIAGMTCLGRQRTLHVLMAGLFAFVFFSWVAFLFVPSIGIFMEPIPGGEFQARMGGISHPNTLGIFSGVFASLLIAQGMQKEIPWRWIAIPLLLTVAAMVLSLSRTSMGALLISTLIVNRGQLKNRQVLILALVGVGTVIAVMFLYTLTSDPTMYTDKILAKFSKSGDVDELTSGTGRSEIWAFAIERIGERPLFGNGLATSKTVMVDYSGYTHNMWLNLFYSSGIFCGLCGVILSLYLLLRVFIRPNPLVDGAAIFILLNGIAENVVFSPIPSGPTMVLILVTAWPVFAPRKKTRAEMEDELIGLEKEGQPELRRADS